MQFFKSRPPGPPEISADATSNLGVTEQSPGPDVLAALAACGVKATRALLKNRPKLGRQRQTRLTALGRRGVEQSRAEDGVSIEDLADAARLFEDIDGAATSVRRAVPPIRMHLDAQTHEYGADPMLWMRTKAGSAFKPVAAAEKRPAQGRGWLMSLFF